MKRKGQRQGPRGQGERVWEKGREHREIGMRPREREPAGNVIVGYHPIKEALLTVPERVEKLIVSMGRRDSRIGEILELARSKRIPINRLNPSIFRRVFGGRSPQSLAAQVATRSYDDAETLLRAGVHAPLLVVVDEVTDPRNLGSIFRSAAAVGVDGVFLPTRRVAPLSAVVEKASAGAVNHIRMARVVNIATLLRTLHDRGIQTIGMVPGAPLSYLECDLTQPTAVVVGGEENGLRHLVRETCTRLVSIPMAGTLDSLNVSVATAVVLYEASRQRTKMPAVPEA
ncbi:MAG: 23S rRNA (guanosine(2251)-2'-O)-methyltransferase RlmB [Acidobacteria bacterium]|nr:23S rRNA (guanosine(2251)-2'-O)-methyltransferase RlmB [Acidobacteriota bacterium]